MFAFPSRMCIVLRKKSQNEGARGMATLKTISNRLKSVKNIQKITQSMKMVSAAKFSRAERELRLIKPLGEAAKLFYTTTEIGTYKVEQPPEDTARKILYVLITSDRGLCGAVHASVAKVFRKSTPEGDNVRIVCVGDKARSLLHRNYGNKFLFVCNEVGRVPPTFLDASKIANQILQSEFQFDVIKIIYNRFRTVVSNVTEEVDFYNVDTVLNAPKLQLYEDSYDENVFSFVEFSIGVFIFYAMKEGAASEQASRMTAMDNSSKNAGEMINKLTLTFNRTRQAVITRELIEIISGASAL